MELIAALFDGIFFLGFFIITVLGLMYYFEMYQNTKDKNSFVMLNPFYLFEESLFNDRGNSARKKSLVLTIVSLVWLVLFLAVKAFVRYLPGVPYAQ